MFLEGAAAAAFDAILKRDTGEERFYERSSIENQALFERDVEDLDARSFEASDLDTRSLANVVELKARSFDEEDIKLRSFEDSSTRFF